MIQSPQSSYILKCFMNPTHVSTHIQFTFSSLSARELLARKILTEKTVLIRKLSLLPPELWGYLWNYPAFPAQILAFKYWGSDAGRDRIAQEVPRSLTSCLFNDCWGLSMLWRLFVNTNKSEQFWATAPAKHVLFLPDEKKKKGYALTKNEKESHPWLEWIQGRLFWSSEDGRKNDVPCSADVFWKYQLHQGNTCHAASTYGKGIPSPA